MNIESGTPVSTIVMTVDVVNESDAPGRILVDMQRILISAVGFSAELQVVSSSRTKTAFQLIFKPDAEIMVLLQNIVASLDKLERKNNIETRLLVHSGLVFSQQDSNKLVYVGSALRTLQSCLQSAEPRKLRLVTQAFARTSQPWTGANFCIRKSHGQLMPFEFSQSLQKDKTTDKNSVSLSPAQLNEIGSRLAQYLGPLATALVADFARQSSTALSLVRNLGGEIGDPKERRRFEEDMQYFLDGWSKP
ncbi:MAG: hypothetical protein WBA20_21625 [Ketobacter sp.]